MKICLSVALVAGMAVAAHAQSLGFTVVYSDQISDTIGKVESVGVTESLVDFRSFQSDADTRLSWLFQGPDGNWYVGNAPVPISNPSNHSIFRVNNLFGTASVSTFASGEPIQNPVGMIYDSASNSIIGINNPSQPISQTKRDGIFKADFNTGVTNVVFDEPDITTTLTPRWDTGHHIIRDTTTSNYIVTCVNGGTFGGTPQIDSAGSTLWYFDSSTNSVSLLADLSTALPGNQPLSRLTGVTQAAGDNDLFICNTEFGNGDGAIYRVLRNDVTGAYEGLTLVLDGLTQPEQIIYNPFNNTLIVNERANYDGANGEPAGTARILEIGLDGSGLRTLASGVHARGLAVVPSPGTLAMVGLAGLAAARRRRA